MAEKQSYVFEEISDCADILNIKEIRGGTRKIVKRKKKSKRTRKLFS
jgi:hypothetical protein